MEIQTWKAIWQVVFFAAGVLFYATAVVVIFKGFGDVVEMVGQMLSNRRSDRSRRRT